MTGESAFSAERRAVISQRLTELIPFDSMASARSRSGVSIKKLAAILESSPAFATMVLNRTDRHLSFAHGQKIAAALGVGVEYILAADLLDRFPTTQTLDAATMNDRAPLRELLMRLYARQVELRYGRPEVKGRRDMSLVFLQGWREVIRLRLAAHLPAKLSTDSNPRIDIPKLAGILRRADSTVHQMIWGPKFITFGDAEDLGRALGVPADWLVAEDVLEELADAAEVDLVSTNETYNLRLMLFRRYADRVLSCQRELRSGS